METEWGVEWYQLSKNFEGETPLMVPWYDPGRVSAGNPGAGCE